MLRAVLFDLDGVIIDTERFGHRVAFNQAFAQLGYPDVVWNEEFYHQLLQVGGGKERIEYYFKNFHHGSPVPADMETFIAKMHTLKTDIFVDMLPGLPLRPGIRRFMRELRDQKIILGICTTSNPRVATTVAEQILPEIPFAIILAGGMVKRKKPDPEIYQTALASLSIHPEECLVVEDSHIGVQAAKQAGCWVLATSNSYTEKEDLSAADFIVTCLGDPDGEECVVTKQRFPIAANGWVEADLKHFKKFCDNRS